MSKSMINRRAYQLISALLLTFSISILVGQSAPVRAQVNESEEFFDQGEREFEQEAETLEKPQNSNSQPLLTIDEEPPTEAATESMEEQRGQQEQKLEQQLNIGEQNPGEPKIEDVSSPNEELRLDDNEPNQPAKQEVEVKF